MSIFYPDYQNSILSLISSLLHSYDVHTPHPGLPLLEDVLAARSKNTILLILDGLGSDSLAGILPGYSFLNSHKVADLSSVCPCTTAAATTTLSSGLTPLEHGWLGWSPWFKEFGRIVDVFLDRDSFSGTAIDPSPAGLLLAYPDIAGKLARQKDGAIGIHRLMPSFAKNGFESLQLMAERMREICHLDGPQLMLAYWHEPDTRMHNNGPWSDAVREEMAAIDQTLSGLFQAVDNLTMIVSADHGQVVVEREVFLDELPELHDCLILPPSLETRAVSLFVKPEKKAFFISRFEDILGDSFLLMPRQAVFKRGLLGSGTPHPKVDDFVGDFIAFATGHTIIRYRTRFNKPHKPFKGHHAGLRSEEMQVPLIIAQK